MLFDGPGEPGSDLGTGGRRLSRVLPATTVRPGPPPPPSGAVSFRHPRQRRFRCGRPLFPLIAFYMSRLELHVRYS